MGIINSVISISHDWRMVDRSSVLAQAGLGRITAHSIIYELGNLGTVTLLSGLQIPTHKKGITVPAMPDSWEN